MNTRVSLPSWTGGLNLRFLPSEPRQPPGLPPAPDVSTYSLDLGNTTASDLPDPDPRSVSQIKCSFWKRWAPTFLVLIAVTALNADDLEVSVVARIGQAGLTGIKGSPSINNLGDTAFVGFVEGGEGLFLANQNGAVNLSPNHAHRTFSPVVQINNLRNAIARDYTPP